MNITASTSSSSRSVSKKVEVLKAAATAAAAARARASARLSVGAVEAAKRHRSPGSQLSETHHRFSGKAQQQDAMTITASRSGSSARATSSRIESMGMIMSKSFDVGMVGGMGGHGANDNKGIGVSAASRADGISNVKSCAGMGMGVGMTASTSSPSRRKTETLMSVDSLKTMMRRDANMALVSSHYTAPNPGKFAPPNK